MSGGTVFAGIDVSKAYLDVEVRPNGQHPAVGRAVNLRRLEFFI